MAFLHIACKSYDSPSGIKNDRQIIKFAVENDKTALKSIDKGKIM